MHGSGRKSDDIRDKLHVRKKLKIGPGNKSNSYTLPTNRGATNSVLRLEADGVASWQEGAVMSTDHGISEEVIVINDEPILDQNGDIKVTWSSNQPGDTHTGMNAVDYVTNTRWISGSFTYSGGPYSGSETFTVDGSPVNGEWIKFEFTTCMPFISHYNFSSTSNPPSNAPNDWTLAGSMDGVTWFTLDKQTAKGGTYTGGIDDIDMFACSNPKVVKFVLLIIESVVSSNTSLIYELRYYGVKTRIKYADINVLEKADAYDLNVCNSLTTGMTNESRVFMGKDVQTHAYQSVTIGDDAKTNGVNATAVGFGAVAEEASVAVGAGAFTGTRDAVAIGNLAIAAEDCLAIGRNSHGQSLWSAAIGHESKCAIKGTAVGCCTVTTGTHATVAGYQASSTHDHAIALGANATTAADRSLRIGSSDPSESCTSITVGESGVCSVGSNVFPFKEIHVEQVIPAIPSIWTTTQAASALKKMNRFNPTTSSISQPLPTAVSKEGNELTFFNDGTNDLILTPDGTDTIHNTSSFTIKGKCAYRIMPYDANWYVWPLDTIDTRTRDVYANDLFVNCIFAQDVSAVNEINSRFQKSNIATLTPSSSTPADLCRYNLCGGNISVNLPPTANYQGVDLWFFNDGAYNIPLIRDGDDTIDGIAGSYVTQPGTVHALVAISTNWFVKSKII